MVVTKSNSHSSDRFFWADVIRIVAIFLVIFIHNVFFLPQKSQQTLWMWVPYLYAQLGVPLFVMISGALLLGKEESLRVFFHKRVGVVLIPWIFWIIVYIALDTFYLHVQPQSSASWLAYLYKMFFSRFWFLPMIFGLYLITPIVRIFVRHADKKTFLYSLSLWFFAFALLPAFYKTLGVFSSLDSSLLRQVFQYSGLFVLGYLLAKTQSLHKSLRFWIAVFIGSMSLTYLSVLLSSTLYNEVNIDPFFHRLFSPTMIPGTVALFMILFLLSRTYEKKISFRVKGLIAQMSQAALGIYLVHEIVQGSIAQGIPQVDQLLFRMPPLLAVPARAILVFLLSFLIIFTLKKVPLVRKFT